MEVRNEFDRRLNSAGESIAGELPEGGAVPTVLREAQVNPNKQEDPMNPKVYAFCISRGMAPKGWRMEVRNGKPVFLFTNA
jgi:hypothetical protein